MSNRGLWLDVTRAEGKIACAVEPPASMAAKMSGQRMGDDPLDANRTKNPLNFRERAADVTSGGGTRSAAADRCNPKAFGGGVG
jgi:hypothetical protein